MNIGSFVATVVMAFMSLFGGLFHHGPPPMQNGQASSTPPADWISPPNTSEGQSIPSGSQNSNYQSSAQPQSNSSSQASSSVSTTLPSGSAWESTVPLGDYKYTTSAPKTGYIYLCHVQSGGQGAQGTPTWISGNVWYPNEKVNVEGSVSWPNASYSMTISGSERTIKSNGLPTDHDTGTFPIARTDPAYQFDANPNSIEAQNYNYELPVDPTMLATPDCIYGEVGMMNDGVPLFDGFDAEYRDALAHETLDQWNGHPDQTGVYHNHGFEQGPVKDPVSTVVGYAFDGYPITGSLLPDGNYLHTVDLDECHGITSTITLDGKSVTMYHYVLTQDFPYTVGCFRGTSYEPKPGGGSGSSAGNMEMGSQTNMNMQSGSQGSPPTPPQAAITVCQSESLGSRCSFTDGQRTIPGTCLNAPNESQLVCIPTN
jgi:hypothetical protein